MEFSHTPVMLTEILEGLAILEGGQYVDGTAGGGGHTRKILELAGAGGRVLGLDQDPDAITYLSENLKPHAPNLTLRHSNFSQLDGILAELKWGTMDGILLDLGLSSYQLEDAGRGFSFQRDEPLDMRMNSSAGEPASLIINRLPEKELADLIYKYGEERGSRRIARFIVNARSKSPFTSSLALANLVRKSLGNRGGKRPRIDSATRTFQALRLAVNRELEHLEEFLAKAPGLLKTGGRLAIISFHSLEDRLVKRAFIRPRKGQDVSGQIVAITKKPLRATDEEVDKNPRSRSAKLRVGEKR